MGSPVSFTDYLKQIFELSNEDEDFTDKHFERQEVKKNEVLLNCGEVCSKLHFVSEGLLRTFNISKNRTEFTRLFAQEGKCCTVLLSFQEKIPSPATIQVIENSVLYSISHTNFIKIISASAAAKNIYTTILEHYQNFQIARLEFLTTLSPKEKVGEFLKENSSLELRVSDKIIASYLQITPET